MQKKLTANLIPILFISAVILIAYWQVVFGAYTMKWDMMDYHLPSRYFLSACFQAHQLPLWCPYAMLGYPFYADPQGGLWYPVSCLFALVGYNIYTVQIEHVLHLIIASVGMYKLIRTTGNTALAATVAGTVYSLTGFFTGHATHVGLVVSMAWMPWVFHYVINALKTNNLYYFLLAGLAFSLLLTGGYVAFTVLCCYSLLPIVLYYLYKYRTQLPLLKKALAYGTLAIGVAMLCSAGYLVSVVECAPFIKRGDALSLEKVLVNSLTPQSLISLVFPFSVSANVSFFETDMTMRNTYMGLAMLPLLLLGLTVTHNRRNLLLAGVGLFCLAAALGTSLPVREWLYHTIPFMKHFRHPSIFRVATTICFLLIAADGIQVVEQGRKKLVVVLSGMAIVLCGIIAYAVTREGGIGSLPNFLSVASISSFHQTDGVRHHVMAELPIKLALLLPVLGLAVKLKPHHLPLLICGWWVTDMAITQQICLPGTVISERKGNDFHENFSRLPQGFPLPTDTPVGIITHHPEINLQPAYYNLQMFHKEVTHDGFNPFVLKTFDTLMNSPLGNHTLWQKMAFVSGSIKPFDKLLPDLETGGVDNKQQYAYISQTIGDTAEGNSKVSISLLNPTEIRVEVSSSKASFLTITQSYFKGWQAKVNGLSVKIIPTNYNLMTVPVPAGQSAVQLTFTRFYVKWLLVLQWLLFTGLLVYCAVYQIRNY